VTARKAQPDPSARESAAGHRLLFEANPQPMWVYDVETLAFLDVNRAAVVRYGWSREEFLAMTVRDIRPESELGRLERSVRDAPQDAERSGVWIHRTRAGVELRVEVLSQPVVWAGRAGRLVVVLDVTARESAEAALRESEARYRELVEDLNDVLFEIDATGRFTFLSPSIEPTLGYRADELVGTPWLAIVAPADRATVTDFVRRALEAGEAVPLEYRVLHRNGGIRWARSFGRPVEREGRIVGLRGVAADISDFKETESKLLAAREQLLQAQKMEAIGRLAGGIAHDFNNLLTVIQGYGELVQHGLSESDEHQAAIAQILRASERAAELTRRLLAFGRRQVLRPAPTDLNAVVGQVEKILRRILGEDVEIVLRLAGRLEPVNVDASQMQQVLLNLALNARDAMPGGGRLTLASSAVELGADDAAAVGLPPGSYVELRVADTGQGIPAEIRELIFEPFFTTKEPGKGTGLGLSSVYGIVRQSGGAVDLTSQVGRGSVFTVYLPTAETSTAPEEILREPPETIGRAEAPTVLVVDDDAAVRRIVRRTLEGSGYRVLDAGGAAEALALARRSADPVELLLIDFLVPGPGGVDLVRRLLERWPDARVLLSSGYAGEVVGIGAAPGRNFPVVQKPFSPRRLLEKVHEALEAGD
jgi:two-component system, cell cycle sensor histidine kinase and response regulator CckA